MQLGNLKQCLSSMRCNKFTNVGIHLAAGPLLEREVVLLTHGIEGFQKRIAGNNGPGSDG